MFANNPTDIDQQPTDLDYWVGRATKDRGSRSEWHLVYQGVNLVVHPQRAALLRFDDREILLDHDPVRYKGRGWRANLCGDIEAAVAQIKAGGGKTITEIFGDIIRKEQVRRKNGGQRPLPERESWVEWAMDDELPLIMGAWLHEAGIVSGKWSINRQAVVDFTPTNREFDDSGMAMNPKATWVMVRRIVAERMKAAGVEVA